MTRNKAAWFWILSVLVIASWLTSGCESMSGDRDREKDRDRLARRERRERDQARDRDTNLDRGDDAIIGRDPARRRDRDSEPVGSSRRGIEDIPKRAVKVREGDGRELNYQPERDGRVYVYDVDDDRIVYSGNVRADDRFVLDPERNTASVGSREVNLDRDLSTRNRYRVYFDQD